MGKKKPFVLGVVGSARKGGNSDVLCDRVLAGARSRGAKVEKISLGSMNIRPCTGCGACQGWRPRKCVFEDDMTPVYDLLQRADALVLASPIYFFSVSGQMKVFLDKLYPFAMDDRLALRAKKAVCCLVYGAPDALRSGCDNAARTLNDVFTYAKIPVQFVHASAGKKGQVRRNRAVMRQAYRAGRDLVG